MTRGGSRAQRGFTTAELLVVLGIAAAVMAMTLITAQAALPVWQVRQAVLSVAGSLRQARVDAIRDATSGTCATPDNCMTVPFDTATNRYLIQRSGEAALTTRTLPRGVRFIRPDAGDAVTLLDGNGDTTAVFTSKGLLNSTNKPAYAHIGHSGRSVYMRVKVSAAGTVRIEDWDGSQWK